MRKTTIILMALIATITANAQMYKIAHPATTKFFKVTATNVNLRKTPNMNGERLMEWYSDAGSYETKCIPFYPSESKGRYRANNRTGAYTEVAHPMKDDVLPMFGKSGEWVNVLYSAGFAVSAPYSKKAYMMGKFGKVYEATSNIGISDLERYVRKNHSNVYSPGATLTTRSGRFSNVKFIAYPCTGEDGNKYIVVAFPFLLENMYLSVPMIYMDVNVSPNNHGRITYEQEMDTIDDMEMFIIHFHSRSNDNKTIAESVMNTLKTMTDADFQSLFKHAFADNVSGYINYTCLVKTTNGEVIDVPLNLENQYLKFYQIGF